MLSAGPGAHHFSPAQNLRVKGGARPIGNVDYRQVSRDAFTIDAGGGLTQALPPGRILALEGERRQRYDREEWLRDFRIDTVGRNAQTGRIGSARGKKGKRLERLKHRGKA